MLKRLLVTTLTAILAVGICYAEQNNAKVSIPINRTSATNGKQMYMSYCAPCHGVDAKGQGPVAHALKMQPSDLTILSKLNNGKFPDSHIVSVLGNGVSIPSHGTADMPVWGPILGKMNQNNPQDRLLRISNLCRYLQTIQVK